MTQMRPAPSSEADELIARLDDFIRRHHRNTAVRGLLMTIGAVIAGYLAVALAEQVGRFGTGGRTALFYGFMALAAAAAVRGVVLPLLRLLHIRGGLDHAAASRIIGDHFPEVADKLLNTLQLTAQYAEAPEGTRELILASIRQRTEALKAVPFIGAIDFSATRRMLRVALPPALTLVFLMLWKPEFLREPTERIVAHGTEFERPAPFRFVLKSTELTAVVATSFEVVVAVEGATRPAAVWIEYGGGRHRMETAGRDTWRHVIPMVREDVAFRFSGGGVTSVEHTLKALPVPALAGFTVEAVAPAYTGVGTRTLENTGDLVVPEGTVLTWSFATRDTDRLDLVFGSTTVQPERGPAGRFSHTLKALASLPYWIVPQNDALATHDSIRYDIRVIPDGAPSIAVEELPDSVYRTLRDFRGWVQDDYGFTRLELVVRWVEGAKPPGTIDRIPLPRPAGNRDVFVYRWDASSLGVGPGDVLEYWFEVWDNDGIRGPKSTRSTTRVLDTPDADELREERNAAGEALAEQLDEALQDARALNKELEDIERALREGKELSWQDKRALEEFLQRQEELQQQLQELQQANEERTDRASEFSETENRILEKQELLQQMLENILSDEMKELMQEMRDLLEQQGEEALDSMQERLDEMEINQESLEKELDRALEQFKQMEWEMRMEEVAGALEELAQDQLDLAEETKEQQTPASELKEKQDALNERFDKLQDELDALEKQNAELENPNGMPDTSEEEESIQNELNKSSQQLESGKPSKASESQKKAGQQMQEMSQQMSALLAAMEGEQQTEDLEALRALLENVLTLSFEQESVMEAVRTTGPDDPRYTQHGKTQRRLRDDSRMVEDSLLALAKRVPQLSAAVHREIGLVNHHMDKALGQFGERQTATITMDQQYVMTSFNNLALMLDEALRQMQQAMANAQPGSGNCEKPGGNGSKVSAGDLKRMQQALGEQLSKMKESMGREGSNGRGLSEQWARMAAQQAALRKLAEKKAGELNEDGSGQGNGMKEIARAMEELERDLVRKTLNPETLKRQRDIETRLLEAENAERKRGEDTERTSRTGRDAERTPPPSLLDFLNRKEREAELLRTVPLELDPFYRQRVNEYFNTLDGPKQAPFLQQ